MNIVETWFGTLLNINIKVIKVMHIYVSNKEMGWPTLRCDEKDNACVISAAHCMSVNEMVIIAMCSACFHLSDHPDGADWWKHSAKQHSCNRIFVRLPKQSQSIRRSEHESLNVQYVLEEKKKKKSFFDFCTL